MRQLANIHSCLLSFFCQKYKKLDSTKNYLVFGNYVIDVTAASPWSMVTLEIPALLSNSLLQQI